MSHKLSRKRRLSLTAAAEEVAEKPKCVVGQVEEHFAAEGPDIGTLDRYKSAEFLAENTRKCLRKLPNLSESLDRFERLFAGINASGDVQAEPKSSAVSRARPYPIAEMAPVKRPSVSVEAEKV